MTPSAIRHILIVGGGSPGWLAALYLARLLRNRPTEITLVESSQIETAGVGEATIPSMVRYLRALWLDEQEFMRRCNATYRLGTLIRDWVAPGQDYFRAFGPCGGRIDGIDLFHFWLRNRLATDDPRPYASHSLQSLAAMAGKAPRSIPQGSPIIDSGGYAYHLDAAAMAEYLRELAIRDGVRHVFDEAKDVALRPDGLVETVHTEGGRALSADLFIDCTGFAGVLIEKGLGDPWIDLGRQLLCDRAMVLSGEKDEEMPPFTRVTALEAGWMWEIPLGHRSGSGYVYSGAHLSDDAAADRLTRATGLRRTRAADPRLLAMRVGHRTEFWRGNVVAIGPSSGSIEPLESTELYFVHRALDLLRTHFPDPSFARGTRAAYNRAMRAAYDEVRDFVLLQYLLAARDDTEFWRDSRAVPVPTTLAEALEVYDDAGVLDLARQSVFAETDHYFVLAGSGRLPRRPTLQAELAELRRLSGILRDIDAQNEAVIADLPSHRTYVQWLHGSGGDDWPIDETVVAAVPTAPG